MESSRDKDLKSERDRSNFGVFFLCLASSRLPTLDPPWCRCGSPRGISFFLPSLPPPGSRARTTPWILKCRQKVPLPPRSFLSHRTSVKRPRSPSPTLSSANAVILSKITLKLEQAFSPLQKSKGQNLVLPARLVFLHTEGDGSGAQRQVKQGGDLLL